MSAPLFPDPALTASIYSSGRLDPVLFGAIVPFWRELRRHDPERLCYLWLMRYGKGGEHLKVRVHGPESLRLRQRRLLEEKVTGLLGSLPETAPPQGKPGRAPAIDAEDEAAGHPDRTLLWTTYRRSHISLGGKPFLADDRYAALLTRCLGAGCERVLALSPGADGSLPHAARQNALLNALIPGLAALGFPAGKRADYLAYHRDWLLRSILPTDQRAEAAAVERLCRRFDERIARMGETLLAIQEAAQAEWEGDGEEGPNEDWKRSLAALLNYVAPLCRDPGYRLDPFASDPVFAPVFKVFHGLANQLGLRQVDEAFIHHLLLRSAGR